ncbi:unnamed protein product [Protopolystoma xenopodis]|uniref:Uncharacterized protein n=1 Tax=Protopolystoma xenopodis TaxID=117903 RepID=A0A448XRU7_9PLAT|nr:unnamed protein product [Protopolystoma xenopodis]
MHAHLIRNSSTTLLSKLVNGADRSQTPGSNLSNPTGSSINMANQVSPAPKMSGGVASGLSTNGIADNLTNLLPVGARGTEMRISLTSAPAHPVPGSSPLWALVNLVGLTGQLSWLAGVFTRRGSSTHLWTARLIQTVSRTTVEATTGQRVTDLLTRVTEALQTTRRLRQQASNSTLALGSSSGSNSCSATSLGGRVALGPDGPLSLRSQTSWKRICQEYARMKSSRSAGLQRHVMIVNTGKNKGLLA